MSEISSSVFLKSRAMGFAFLALTSWGQEPSCTHWAKTERKELWFLFINLYPVIQFLPQIAPFDSHSRRKTKPQVHSPLGNKLSHYNIQLAGRQMLLMILREQSWNITVACIVRRDWAIHSKTRHQQNITPVHQILIP